MQVIIFVLILICAVGVVKKLFQLIRIIKNDINGGCPHHKITCPYITDYCVCTYHDGTRNCPYKAINLKFSEV